MPATPDLPVTTAATFCATLVDEWARAGVTDAVIAPGSRSTPMALALTDHEGVRAHVHHDERSAAFIGLGLGLATGRPAVVLTTSGTAAVEAHPAVVEAHHARVPLIVCTADRPPELRGVGAPQTIDQTGLYGGAARWFHDPGVPDDAAVSSWRALGARAVLEATGRPSGPVHLNLPFREPLVGRAGPLPVGRDGGAPWHRRVEAEARLTRDRAGLVAAWCRGRRGVIVAGAGIDRPEPVLTLARVLGWPVLADPQSGCRLGDPAVVAHADPILRSPVGLVPEVVVRFGAPPASKVLATWLAGLDAVQIAVERTGVWFDPEHTAALVVAAEPGEVAAVVAPLLDGEGAPSEWIDRWAELSAVARDAIAGVLVEGDEPVEPAVARDVMAALPGGATLVVSSSMPVRDLEWFSAPRSGVRVLANRGANGIDGVVSTAVGVALSGGPTAVLVGDVAFLHDSNALLGIARRGIDLTVVVVDNDGGGIFSFLPPADALDHDRFELLYGTPHGVDVAALAGAHDVPVAVAERRVDVRPLVAGAVGHGEVRLVVVRTDRAANVVCHEALHAAVADALAGLNG